MPLIDQIQKDITAAMKAREEAKLSTLRMVKSALQNRAIEKMSPLDDKEAQQVLGTLIKQRKDSIEQFTKGGRQEMADKEAAEIIVIESYMPKAASEADIAAGVKAVIAEMGSPTMKDMGTVMKNVMAKFVRPRHARRWESGKRSGEEGIGREVSRVGIAALGCPAERSSEAIFLTSAPAKSASPARPDSRGRLSPRKSFECLPFPIRGALRNSALFSGFLQRRLFV